MSEQAFPHDPVMVDEVVDVFAVVPPGTVLDATVGGGGHAEALLDRYSQLSVLGLDRDEQALYELVWMRTVASQMADARGQTVSLRVGAIAGTGEDVEFGVSGTVITFRGFLAAYEEVA